MAPDFFAEADVLMDEVLAGGVVQDVEAFVVADRVGVRSGGDVDRIRSLLQNLPGIHFLEGFDGGIGIHVPVEHHASDAVRNGEQARQ